MFNISRSIVVQVNPHSIPFAWDLRGHDQQNSLHDVYQITKTICHNTISYAIEQLTLLGLASRDLTNCRNYTYETFKGDVQIIGPATFGDAMNLFSNMTKEVFEKAV